MVYAIFFNKEKSYVCAVKKVFLWNADVPSPFQLKLLYHWTGITTGISSADRAKTVNLLAADNAKATDFARPGHIFPLRARDGGVLERDGHTEAAVDISALAGRARSGILCEIVSEENPTEMARLPELKRFCKKHGLVLTSIVDLAQYRKETESESGIWGQLILPGPRLYEKQWIQKQ